MRGLLDDVARTSKTGAASRLVISTNVGEISHQMVLLNACDVIEKGRSFRLGNFDDLIKQHADSDHLRANVESIRSGLTQKVNNLNDFARAPLIRSWRDVEHAKAPCPDGQGGALSKIHRITGVPGSILVERYVQTHTYGDCSCTGFISDQNF